MASLPVTKRKPRLSLQIQTTGNSPPRAPRGQTVDSKDPTAFNTLSNAYLTAIERSSLANSEPLTAINTLQAFSLVTPIEAPDLKRRVVTPYVANYPETPLTAHATSPRPLEINYPSMMTATPPLSGTTDSNESKVFTFSSTDARKVAEGRGADRFAEPRTMMQKLSIPRAGALVGGLPPPYTPSRATHSILRNSPLPPRTAIPPPSPRRQSLRLQEKAARRVGYNSPLEQEIVTLKYTKSHIDLLTEEASPNSPAGLPSGPEDVLDVALAFTPNELQDGGQTPGPFEETRRRVAGFVSPGTPAAAGGIRKRKKKEKKRRWVWTIGQEEDEDDENVGGAVAAIRADAARTKKQVTRPRADERLAPQSVPSIGFVDETPTPSVESSDSWNEYRDVVMSDTSSITSEDAIDEREDSLQPGNMDVDLKTPTAPRQDGPGNGQQPQRDTPIPELNRDTPIPPEAAGPKRDTPVPSEYIY